MMRLWRWLGAGLLLFTAGGCQAVEPRAVAAPGGTQPAATAAPAPQLAPDFTLAALDGPPVTLSALHGRWVLVNFWATWCAPCRDEMPYLAELAATEADKLTVLAVNMRERPEQVRAFLDEVGVKLPILMMPDDVTLLAYRVSGLPVSFLIAPDGTLARRMPGPVQPGDLILPDAP